jgi:cytochrome P450 family 709
MHDLRLRACLQLHMVLLETLRLYPPIVYIQRRTASDVVLRGMLQVPEGTVVSIPIGLLQRDREVWGSDADEFNPLRFSNGVARAATDPHALLSFSLGPRACTGKSFGIIEAQIVMAVILRNFSFSLSPTYVHKPKYVVSLTPKCGMPLILKNIHA